ncbi:soluble lamin-associated protein of 75 kDa [Electrophorus electricus]|uniref:soluble lamin-associated protein of 75 kDa n=1 Tax=Electrophorus electricus TaxID=8005 RepID=UPI0015D0275C|nr:soluble lamin-associated protein of 75 kDa [Electrophorus electricus]XP_035377311.1 soluble lamin-associated protein of 75 kDa [Electrophorus electricus]XP_035377312.1 soluble lamin-associated protein of 75 kDa [Electrophorus electricus]
MKFCLFFSKKPVRIKIEENIQRAPRLQGDGMKFPVDTLESVHHGQLELSGQVYMDELLHGNPDHAHYFLLPSGRKVQISLSSVGFVPLYGANLEHKILALFAPEDPLTAVALLLSDQWYAVENILRTANPTREGLFQVRSVVDRVILYVLNRIVYRTSEMAAGDVPFLCHDKNDYAKILWHGGEAVGFYSIKTKGSWSQFCLPVMNSIFVRKGHRGNGHGLRMLEDFVDSFKEDELGLKYPLSPAMSQVCQRYLARYPADVELLWEVEGLGRSYQKTLLANRLSALALAGGGCQDEQENGATAEVDVMDGSIRELTEKANAVNKHLTFAEEGDDRPISTRTRSSEHRWRKRGREELAEGVAEPQPKKMNRGEELWPETMEPPTAVISAAEHEGVEDAEKSPPAGGMGEASVTCEAMDQEAKDLVMEVNGSGSEEEEESMAEKAEEDAAPSLQNGMVREEEEEMEEECIEDPAAVNSVDKLKEAAREKQEEEDKRGKGKDSAPEDKQEDETPAAVEGEQRQEVTSASEDVDFVEDTEEDEGLWASLEEEEEEEPSVSDEKQEGGHGAEEIKPGQSEAPPSSPEGEITETSSLEEATGTPLKGEPGPKAPENEEHSSVGPGGVMDTSDHPSEDEEQKADEQDEVSKEKRVEQKEERREATEKTDGMAEDEAGGEADGNAGARDVWVHRGGRSKAAHPGPKHASRKLGKATAQAVEELDEVVAEDEEGGVSTEEEAEHSLEEEGQREVIDMRVLRGKTKVVQATPQHRAKRRSKM